jgi:hypothetical protein
MIKDPFEKDSFELWPKLFKKDKCFDLSFGPGWNKIVEDLCDKISLIINSLPENEQEELYVVQIKEKFGGLRFYMSAYNEEIEILIKEAEKLCYNTCESCGEPGEIRDKDNAWWLKVRCDKCQQEHLKILNVITAEVKLKTKFFS